ncbi:MAG TPA: hypothetical protein PLO37_13320 [Candidatus Hydrogenedentes bacterium]|nr:hypothetical protein [Candidatus Hydrogenedentota bacterium]HPG67823.1 hypothetical protein [Candidatus Hydrogenedentota bacterium]
MKQSVPMKPMAWIAVILMAGCVSSPSYEVGGTRKDMRYPGRELDYIARSLDEFGSLTIAGTTLIEPDPQFQFDLDMSAKEMFEWPRLEGFSTLIQNDSLDFQLSVEAQVVKNMLDDAGSGLSGVESNQLAQNLQAAAWRGLLSQIPGGEQLAAALQQPKDTNASAGAAAGDGFIGDGGQSSLSEARVAWSEALSHIAEAAKQYGVVADSNVDDLGAEVALGQLLKQGDDYHASAADTLKAIDLAAREALRLAFEVDSRINTASSDIQKKILSYQALVTSAKAAAELAVSYTTALGTALDAQKKTYADDVKVMPFDTRDKAKAKGGKAIEILVKIEATIDDKPYAVDAALEKAKLAVDDAVAAARAVQVPVTPSVPILEADEIPKDKRLAYGRLLKDEDRLPTLKDPTGGLKQNLRQLLLDTASDDMTYNMLRWLSYPESFGPGKRVYLCMTTVSCMPGYRSRKGFQGQIDLSLTLARASKGYNGEEQLVPTGATPLVFSAYPLVGTQLLDLRTSRRQIFTMAMQLVVTGYPAAARALLDFASEREQNIETLTGINTITSFGSGNHVGFTFSPRFQAQADPTSVNTKPAWVLQPETFPAVILVVIDEHDLITNNQENGADRLIWRHNFRWMPTGKCNGGYVGRPAFSESDLGRRAEFLEEAYQALQNGGLAADGWPTSFAAQTLEKRIEYFKTMACGEDVYMTLPLFSCDAPSCGNEEITVNPTHIWTDAPTTLYVTVPATWKNYLDVTVAGKNVNASRLSPTLVRVNVPALGDSAVPAMPHDDEESQGNPAAANTGNAPPRAQQVTQTSAREAQAQVVSVEKTPKTTELVVANGTCAVPKTLTYGRLNEAPPKKEKEPEVVEKLGPGGIAEGQCVGYIVGPKVLRLELNKENEFSLKLYKELKDDKGKAITAGTLIFRLREDWSKSVKVRAKIDGLKLTQEEKFMRTAEATYNLDGLKDLITTDPGTERRVQVALKYRPAIDALEVERDLVGTVCFSH